MANPQESTGEQPISRTREEVINEAKRLEESLLYSSKGHYAAATRWRSCHLWIGIPLCVLSAMGGIQAVQSAGKGTNWLLLISIVVTALGALLTFLNPSEHSVAHLSAGNDYDSLMAQTRIFRTIECLSGEPDEVLTQRLMDLTEEKTRLNKACAQIPPWAYNIAKRGILQGEGEFSVDKSPPKKPQDPAC
jgi:hypothetical protein